MLGKQEWLRPISKRDSLTAMRSVQTIQEAMRQLSTEELAELRVWFAEFDATRWDRQFESDIAAGRLEQLAHEALKDLRDGRCTDL